MKGTFAPLAQKGREKRERERGGNKKREKKREEEGELAAAGRVRRRTF